jgi:hypothetical protein
MGLTDSDVAQLDLGTTERPTWDATTDTEVVTTTTGFDTSTSGYDTGIETPAGVASGATSAETTYDAGAGTESSLSGSDTSFRPAGESTTEYGLERETIQRPPEDDTLDAP